MKEVPIPLRKAPVSIRRCDPIAHRPVVSTTVKKMYSGLSAVDYKEEPWKGKIVNSTDYPTLCKIERCNLQPKIGLTRQLKYGRNVNIQMMSVQTLGFAVTENISQEKMRRKIFVFDDFGFQQASANYWGVREKLVLEQAPPQIKQFSKPKTPDSHGSFLSNIGPPEIYHPAPPTNTARAAIASKQKPKTKAPVWYPQMEIPTLTPCQFVFFKITPNIIPETLTPWLDRAWKEDPTTTLKLICCIGLATIKGKPNKDAFFNSVLRLHKYHHYVLASNLAAFASFGLIRILEPGVAKTVFPFYSDPEYIDIQNAHYFMGFENRLMKEVLKEVLVPLAKAHEKSKDINQAPVRRQDSSFVAMKAYKKVAVAPDEKKKFKQCLKIVDKYGKWTDDDEMNTAPSPSIHSYEQEV
ncbi:unnamed protein product [Dovyalis caffra]|uniref:Uncharacterized protein n=1 Tax=Dovyalis caffra TaxID=77055 RepID=A0AAV1R9D3_9ROSI|nr:unnamed protein product [Dovyalis caffra]